MKMDERVMLKKNDFFTKLLGSPSYGSMEILLRDAADLNLGCTAPFHRIVVAEVELWEEMYARTDKKYDREDRSEILFVLSNLCYELFSCDGICCEHSVDFQGRMVFWINADSNAVTTCQLQEQAIHAAEVLESEYRLFVTFSISEWFDDMFQTFQVYQDTLNILFYHRFLSGKKSAYSMMDIPANSVPISLSQRFSEEKQLLNLIQLGNMEELQDYIYEIFQRRFFDCPPSLHLIPQRKAAFSELLELVVNELAAQYPIVRPELKVATHQMAANETGIGKLEVMEHCINTVMQCKGMEPRETAPAWVGTLKDYVRKNYRDVNLTVYALAEQVDLTPSYCTRVFRRHTGMSLMEYIQRQRVQAAIALLESGCTMVHTAKETGFTCTQTLRRTLKQYRS